MKNTIIHVMRHGEVHNPEGLLYGRLPGFELTSRGHEMAQRVAQSLVDRGADIAQVVASPLKRAQQSAHPTAQAFDLPLLSDTRLIESANHFEGQAVNADRLALAHPRNWKYFIHPLRPSWGEPYSEVASRMRAAIADVLDQVQGREALVVSHQMPIVALTRFVQGKPLAHLPMRRQCSLASLTSLMFDGHTLVGVAYEEPAADLLLGASDMTPGSSAATLKR